MSRGAGDRSFDRDTVLTTERLDLVPLTAGDAEEMADVLGDERLHEFIGGRPATPEERRDNFARLAAGSPNLDELWLNWIVRRRTDGQPVGTVQATVTAVDGRCTAHVAWVIGVEWQNHGFASEAAQGLVAWLLEQGAADVVAHIHPDHRASAAVAIRAGLEPTDEQSDGERVWRRQAERPLG